MDESATLIGMLKNPSLYNPVRFPDQVLKRRNEVLTKVEEQNHLNLTETKELEKQILLLIRG
ncbi:MAG: transglycosylase domain-containing protein [Saprospiraceae bacterium]|nr:transglycosylase domain-containing protein [Saprospiraceae bacterium]